jgi:membrane associated rhomboid family serine protease
VVGATNTTTVPLVSWTLIGINVLVYLATAFGAGGSIGHNEYSDLFGNWVLRPYFVGHDHEYLRMITAAFLHIGPIHLVMNMVGLAMLGPPLERVLGWWRFLAVYLLAALGGSVAILVFGDALVPVAGASGAIYGLFASALVLSRIVGFDTRSLVIIIVLNFFITLSVPGISKLGHIGGFVMGGIATFALLGWTLKARPLTDRTSSAQVTGLLCLLGVLLVITVLRATSLSSFVLPTS